MRRHLLVALWLVASVATAPAAPLVTTPAAPGSSIFGTGADGNVSCSSGTIVLSRDMDYQNLTVSGTCSIVANGWQIYVSDALDVTHAGPDGLTASGAAGSSASGATPGPRAIRPGVGSVPLWPAGGNGGGGHGGTGNATTGTPPDTANAAALLEGGQSGVSGAGGNSTSAGNPGVSPAAPSYAVSIEFPTPTDRFAALWTNSQVSALMLTGGAQGTGGGQGGGDGTNPGGGGGSSGAGGVWLAIHARYIVRGPSTAVGVFSAKGGNGGNGGAGAAGNAAGGGGASGSGGGIVYIVAQALLGSTATNAIDVSGGNGGNGGLGAGTGTAGAGAYAGYGGNYQIIVLDPASFTVGPFGIAPASAPSGSTGGVAATEHGNL